MKIRYNKNKKVSLTHLVGAIERGITMFLSEDLEFLMPLPFQKKL